MKHLASLALLLLAALSWLPSGSKLEGSPTFAGPSPLCDCDSCECVVCNCTDISLSGADGDARSVAETEMDNGQPPTPQGDSKQVQFLSERFTEPQPIRLIEVPTNPHQPPPVVQVSPKPVGVPAGRPVAPAPKVYYSAPQYGSCGPGGCGVRRGLFGRRR